MELIATAHRYRADESTLVVDERTWQDLDLDGVFARVDRTISGPGAQMLYHRLRTYEADDAVLNEQTRQYEVFRKNAPFRDAVRRALMRLSKPASASLAPFVLSPFPEHPPLAWAFALLGLVSFGSLIVGAIVFHPLLVLALLFGLINILINVTYGQRITPHFAGFSQIDQLLRTCADLAKLENPDRLPQVEMLRQSRSWIGRTWMTCHWPCSAI